MRRFAQFAALCCVVAALERLEPGTAAAVKLTIRRGDVATHQANLSSNGNLGVSNLKIVGQSFTMAAAGTLAGIEFAPLRDTAAPGDRIFLDVYLGGSWNTLLGSASILVDGFPPGSGNVPDGLDTVTTGPGYFDLSALRIPVSAGLVLSFRLRPAFPPGICSPVTHRCTSGQVDVSCANSLECERFVRAGENGDFYADGTAIINGDAHSGHDLSFKVLLQAAGSSDAVTLTWTGGAPPYRVFRSDVPSTVLAPPHQVSVLSDRRWVDLPPAGALWSYLVDAEPVLDQYNLVSNTNFVVSRLQSVGQGFTMGAAGTLAGIEFAPLRDTADAGDTIFLDVFDVSSTLLGTASTTAGGFPPGANSVPAALNQSTSGPGSFDLSPLEITVASGEVLSFRLRATFPPGVCNLGTHQCTSGRVGATCFSNALCEKQVRAGQSADTYPGGAAIVNGVPSSGSDLAFKVLLD